MVPVPMPRPALMPGSRGPQAEMVIPPRPNATVTAHRQRAEDGYERCPGRPALASVTPPS
jgi:hypothetical protein